MTTPKRLVPHQASEKLLRDPKYGYTLCRASAIWACCCFATLNESAVAANGRVKGRNGRKRDLAKAWDAAGRGRPGYGQRHVVAMQKSMFPHLPPPILGVTRDFSDDLWDHIGPNLGDFAVSLSIELSALPASDALRRHTGPVAHQVALYRKRKVKSGGQARVLDGMIPYSEKNVGYWAKRSSLAKAAKAIEEGLIIFELYPVGMWTEARLETARKSKRIRDLRGEIEQNKQKVDRLTERLTVAGASVEAAQDLLKEMEEERDEALARLAEGRSGIIDEVVQVVEQLR